MIKLAIVTSHPIQYNAPLFRLLNDRRKINLKVFYTWSQSAGAKYDPGFGKNILWDIPLLGGYDFEFVKNVAINHGTHHFYGISNSTLITEIKDWHPDALLIFGWNFKSHLRCLRYFHKKIPVLFRGDSTLLDDQNSIHKFVRKIFLKWIYSHVDYALYVGKENKKYYLQHGLKTKQLLFAPHAIDNYRFYDKDNIHITEAALWRNEIGIKDNDIVFLFAGKLEPKKNAELLLKAFEKITSTNVHVVIVGNGVLESSLKTKFSKKQNVHFIDFQNQSKMPVVYYLCDVFVLPSKGPGETWGLAVNEAMACSRPVIVSDKCGCANDLVVNGVNGYIFKSDDENDLVIKMNTIISDKDKLKKRGEESMKIIEKYSFQNICKQIENITVNIKK